MADVTHLLSAEQDVGQAWLEYRYNELDDLKALRFWLWRNLGQDAGPYIYIEPFEGTFQRREGQGAITITSLPVRAADKGRRHAVYTETMQLVIGCYGWAPEGQSGRQATVDLGRRVWRLFWEGDAFTPPGRIQMYAPAYRARVARFLRVLQDSLTMGIEDTTDKGLWRRPVEVSIEAPRQRDVRFPPVVDVIGFTQGARP